MLISCTFSCSAVFVNTDSIPARDSRIGDLVQNEVEASLVYQTIEALIRGGIKPEQIGIISMYRQTANTLCSLWPRLSLRSKLACTAKTRHQAISWRMATTPRIERSAQSAFWRYESPLHRTHGQSDVRVPPAGGLRLFS